MPTPNIPLLKKTLAAVKRAEKKFGGEDNPKSWDQSNWRCGTGKCFAGFAVGLAGFGFLVSDKELVEANKTYASFEEGFYNGKLTPEQEQDFIAARDVLGRDELVRRIDTQGRFNGKNKYVSDAARIALGLSYDQADALFAGDNSIEDLETYIKTLAVAPKANLQYSEEA